ncbi:uncharacterized protein LOC127796351 [Diospyros lotus]|uniref:uncharacterized protein LOC127796351 n=1 Tax=Diospyros lotus TaxID=55363 RepID=UPI0022558304|nr:uncharacterized protein LOC127796351 [Diospyros lotus]
MKGIRIPAPFLFLTALLLLTSEITLLHPAFAAAANTTYIRISCQNTTYPGLCYTSLSPYASAVQTSQWRLCNAALSATLQAARNASLSVDNLSKQNGVTAHEAATISDCADNIGDSVDEIQKSIKAFASLRRSGVDKKFQLANIKTWMSAAITDEYTCTDELADGKVSAGVKKQIQKKIGRFSRLTSFDVVMSGKVPASLKFLSNPRYVSLPSSRSFQSKFLVVTCPHETVLPMEWRVHPSLCFSLGARHSSISICKRFDWSIRSRTDGNDLDSPPGNDPSSRTRLFRAIQALLVKVKSRILEIRRGFFMKALFFLIGFYCATAFSTVIGQTGEWDIFSAALAAIVVEGIGALMYKASSSLLNRIRSLITMFNYWKAGLSLGLFLDAFKYEIDNILGFPNPFNFELDAFPLFL